MSPRRFTMRLTEQIGLDYYCLEVEVPEASLAIALDKAYVLEQEYIKLVEQFETETQKARDTYEYATPLGLKEIMDYDTRHK